MNFEWGTWRVKSWFYWVLANHISGWSNAPDKYTLEVIVLALVWRTQNRYILRPRACIFFVWPVGIVVLAEQVKLVWWKMESLYLDKKYGCHLLGSILMKTRFVLHATQNKGYDCCALIFACIHICFQFPSMGILKLEQNYDSTLLWLGNVSIRLIQLGAELWIGRDITLGWLFCHQIDSIWIPRLEQNCELVETLLQVDHFAIKLIQLGYLKLIQIPELDQNCELVETLLWVG